MEGIKIMESIDQIISFVQSEVYSYPDKENMFRPEALYPEYFFKNTNILSNYNKVYDLVRKALFFAGFDKENWGTEKWNPLKEFVSPGQSVLIKPNLVMEINHIKENGVDCLYTNPSVVAAIVDYVVIAQKGYGEIVIGDAPMQECKWDMLMRKSGYETLIEWYKEQGINIKIVDFRELTSEVKKGVHIQTVNENGNGKIIDLSSESEFNGIRPDMYSKLRITNYNPEILFSHHNSTINEYFISNYVLKADVIINMPKPKTHRKAGVTISLKNFVGINVRKEFLPHHTLGPLYELGDEYPNKNYINKWRSRLYDKRNYSSAKGKYFQAIFFQNLSRICTGLLKLNGEKYEEGSWYGNNTISKTIVDLNKIVLYAGKDGLMKNEKQRKIIIVADMIVSGEKEGPVAPTEKKVGAIAVGSNLVCFDEAICTLMGFDSKKIPTISTARKNNGKYRIVEKLDRAFIYSNDVRYNKKTIEDIRKEDVLDFEPTSGWKNHIEIEG